MTKLHHSPVQTFKIPITLSMHPKAPPGLCSSAGSPGCQLLRQPLLPSWRAGHSRRPCIPAGSLLPSGPLQRLFLVPGVLCAFPQLVLLTPGCHSGFSPKTSPEGAPTPRPAVTGGLPGGGRQRLSSPSPQSAHLSSGLFSSGPPGGLDTRVCAPQLSSAAASIPVPPQHSSAHTPQARSNWPSGSCPRE